MEEDKQNAQRTDIFHQEDIKVEISADTQRATISKLIMYQLMRHKPAYQDTGQKTYDRQEDLSCHKVEDVEQRLLEEMKGGACGP